MTTDDIAVRVSNVTKEFKLKQQKGDPLISLFFSKSKDSVKSEVVQVLRGISFEINRGETVAIVGNNGVGKSTLLKIIAGIIQPTSGSVEVRGKLTSLLGRSIGFKKNMSATENIILYGMLLGLSKQEITERVPEVLEYAELEDYADVEIDHFSAGMLARLAFSTSIMVDSDVLLMDEALAVGDYAFHQKSFNAFLELKKQRKTIIFVSHGLEEVVRVADRAILIRDGQIEMIGEPRAVVKRHRELSSEGKPELEPNKNGFNNSIVNMVYPVDSPFLGDGSQAVINRHNWRATVLVDNNGPNIIEKNILDVGSHDGKFMYAALRIGAKFVEGIEPRQNLREAAKANLQHHKVDSSKYKITEVNILQRLRALEPNSYDTIFCFGIIDKMMNRYGIMKEIARLRPSLLIIDASVEEEGMSIESNSSQNSQNSGSNYQATSLEVLTRRLLESLLTTHGFTFKYIDWQENGIVTWAGLEDYRTQRRVSIIAAPPHHES